MIIKTKRSYTSQRYKQLVEYILHDKGRVDQDKTFTICHNLHSTDMSGIIQEFIENDTYRKVRKRGVVLYHDIISWHPEDKDSLSLEVLEEFAQEYIQKRGKNALCLVKPHIENTNIHIHFIFSGTEYMSSKTLRIDNKEFKSIRMEMEEYSQSHPALKKVSLVYLNKWQKTNLLQKDSSSLSEKEFQLKNRTKKASVKDTLRSVVQECFQHSKSKDDFFKQLIDQGIQLYKHRDRISGLKDSLGRKHRFKSLNLTDKAFETFNKNSSRMLELQEIRLQKENKRSKGLDR